jgi:hypothetical protein
MERGAKTESLVEPIGFPFAVTFFLDYIIVLIWLRDRLYKGQGDKYSIG